MILLLLLLLLILLDLLCYKGKRIEKILEKTLYWYNKAANNKNGLAQYNLGQIYRFKLNDKVKAFEYYKKSAEKEYNVAQLQLGLLYESGEGTEKDLEKAIYWYNKEAENGNKINLVNVINWE